MTAAERFKKRLKGKAPHTTKKENKDLINSALLRGTLGLMGPKIKRRSGRNETSSLTRKKGYF
jgi:hypothetical protein